MSRTNEFIIIEGELSSSGKLTNIIACQERIYQSSHFTFIERQSTIKCSNGCESCLVLWCISNLFTAPSRVSPNRDTKVIMFKLV